MSFISVLKTIGADIEKGLEIAAPFVSLIPGGVALGPILIEVAQVITILEASGTVPGATSGKTLDPQVLSAIMQAVVQVHVAKQVPPATPAPRPVVMTTT